MGHEEEFILQMQADKIISRYVYNKPFMIRFLDKGKWASALQPHRNRGLIYSTDGCKTNESIGAGKRDMAQRISLTSAWTAYHSMYMPLRHV